MNDKILQKINWLPKYLKKKKVEWQNVWKKITIDKSQNIWENLNWMTKNFINQLIEWQKYFEKIIEWQNAWKINCLTIL